MIDNTPRRARDHAGVVHEARLGVRLGVAYLHPICDPKVRWDPAWETTCKVVCCFDCLADLRWLEAALPDVQLDEYVSMHQSKHEVIGPRRKERGG